MAGYGNIKAPDYTPDSDSNPRFSPDDSRAYSGGHDIYGSGATGGAGFGNKKASSASQHDTSEFRFGSHSDTNPYSGGHPDYGSGSTGGAGFGNKTGEFVEKNDSTVGKLMEKTGHVLKNEGLVEKGRKKREEKGFGAEEES